MGRLAPHRLTHLPEVVGHDADQGMVGRIGDATRTREERDADDSAAERLAAEQLVELVAQRGADRLAEREVGEVVGAELVGCELRVREDVPLRSARRGVLGDPRADTRRERKRQAGVDREPDEEARWLGRRDRVEREHAELLLPLPQPKEAPERDARRDARA